MFNYKCTGGFVMFTQELIGLIKIAFNDSIYNTLMFIPHHSGFIRDRTGRNIPIANVQIIQLATKSEQNRRITVANKLEMKRFVQDFKILFWINLCSGHAVMRQHNLFDPRVGRVLDTLTQCNAFELTT
jgi:hypothetical protein